ncbi:MAG: hypothetical protein JO166_08375 [Deltaproteobacteria bacterium]|nr:hypothetical protein [Deltaproteobacteria bacterium]
MRAYYTLRGCTFFVVSGWVRRLRVVLLTPLYLLAVSCSSAAWQNADPDTFACGPFGDSPAHFIESAAPYCIGGTRLGPWKDSDSHKRYACLYEPGPAASRGPLPLLIYLHPSLFSTQTIHLTNLLHYQESLQIGARDRHGFIVLEPIGRKTAHYYPFPDREAVGWDNWYRQLNPDGDVTVRGTKYKENVDAATIDHFVAEQTATGKVDRKRIYVTGWSNGAAMGLLYALNRRNIAALAVYSSPDPFGALEDPCPQKPTKHPPDEDAEIQIFNPQLPILEIHPNCDIVGICPNSELLTSQVESVGTNVDDLIVNSLGERVKTCMRACGTNPIGDDDPTTNPLGWTLGLVNHNIWPLTWTRTILEFLRDHPLKFH